MKAVTIIIFIFLSLDSYSQTDSILIKTCYPNKSVLFEEYVISKMDSIKNGSYKRYTAKGKIYVKGLYQNNIRTGIWEFFNRYSGYTELIEKYDYTTGLEIYYKNMNNFQAHFVGGDEELNSYILSNKSLDSLKNINEKILIGFTVDTVGHLKNFKIYRGLRPDIDNLVVEILKDSPKWVPPIKNGFKKEETLNLPIMIRK
jgi:hypothetical protein